METKLKYITNKNLQAFLLERGFEPEFVCQDRCWVFKLTKELKQALEDYDIQMLFYESCRRR